MVYQRHDIGARIQALTLAEYGAPISLISEITGISRRAIYDLKARAKRRGYDPSVSKVIKVEYIVDGARSGRPKKNSEGQEKGGEEEEAAAEEGGAGKNRNAREEVEVQTLESVSSLMLV